MGMLCTADRLVRLGVTLAGAVSLMGLAPSCDTVERPEWVDEDASLEDLGATRDEEMFAKPKGLGGTNGDFDYCNNPAAPCTTGEGDCDNDTQCLGALVCGDNNGPNFGMPANWDVCWPTHCENDILDGDETSVDYGGSCSSENCPPTGASNGDANGFCTLECPCDNGFGDCDQAGHCDPSLMCMNNNGAYWGMPPNYDVCVATHCNNKVQDGDETGVDVGGSCGSPSQCMQETYWQDSDGDGYGDEASPLVGCQGSPPGGYVSNNDDCDDTDIDQFPGALEVCNGEDDDCDVLVDEGAVDYHTYYDDDDTDGYGDPADTIRACSAPAGYVSDHTDCDDTNINVHPGATEICNNGLDDNCDGSPNSCKKTGNVNANGGSYAQFTGGTDDGAGYTLGVGDVDNDGNSDLLIGAPVIPWRLSPALPGRVYLLYGPLAGGTQALSTAAAATFGGEVNQDHAGLGIATGDLDDDGYDDMRFGAADHAQATTGGREYVFYGSGTRFSGTVAMSTADAIIDGVAASAWTAYGNGGGADVNGDVYEDLIIGAPGDLNDGAGGSTGSAYVSYGSATRLSGTTTATAIADATLAGVTTDSSFGNSVALVGDVGGSSTGDVAVGAPGQYWWPALGDEYAGDVHVFFGPVSGSLSASADDVTISGNDTNDWTGVNVMGADLDGDGINELFVSASGDSAVAPEGGKLGIFRGPLPTGAWTMTDADITYRAGNDYQYVGEGVSVGDFDGDGNADIVLSTWGDGAWLFYGPITDGTRSLGSAKLSISTTLGSAQNEGYPVMFVGDVTGDDVDDLAMADVGDTASAGRVYIIEGGGY